MYCKSFLVPLAATLLATVMAGCMSSFKVTSDHVPGTNFSLYKTFSFIPEPSLMVQSAEPFSQQLEGRLKAAASEALMSRGFRQVTNPDDADFLLGFNLGTRDQLQVNNFPDANRGGIRQGGAGPGTTEVRGFTEGRLSIDIFEAKTGKAVWLGSATRAISRSDRGNTTVINKLVRAILEQFPPR